ncbi:hypothetical protein PIB30_114418 [Stylosanthes scabra]|uniref:Uncharacterized protein n=1 Tax=Stylosanthes scabra TaxID=79078 RepID=A0ABU6VZR1_9FABA|nr:hypothetical protein [Stylosanthes scabra]
MKLLDIVGKVSVKDGMDDLISWKFDSSGVYSVKSALQKFSEAQSGSESDQDFNYKMLLWKKIVPPKVEILG